VNVQEVKIFGHGTEYSKRLKDEGRKKRRRVSATDWRAERRSGSRINIRQRYGAMEEKRRGILAGVVRVSGAARELVRAARIEKRLAAGF
jgi:hypothetical protein